MSDYRASIERHAVPFLACLNQCSCDEAWNTLEHWQTFDENKERKDPALAGHRPESIDDAGPRLDGLNRKGAGVFFSVNLTDGMGRKKWHILRIRGWHADLDTKDATNSFDPEKLSLRPTMIVKTPGGWHIYWLVLDPMPCEGEARWKEHEAELRGIQAALTSFGADPMACTVERVLRVPGFMHCKAEPRLVELVTVDGPRYTREQIRAAFPPVVKAPKEQVSKATGALSMVNLPERSEILDRARAYLDTCEPAIQGQNGSGATFNAALKITDGFDMTEDEALSLLWERFNPRCEPPWSMEDLRHKIHDASGKCQDRGHLLRTMPVHTGSNGPLPVPPGDEDTPSRKEWVHPTLPLPPERPRNPWIVGDVAKMLREEPPPVRWLVEGLIPAGAPGLFAARAGAGKSMTSLLIALGLASGRGVLGRAVSPEAFRGVLYAGLEDDEQEFHRRLRNGVELMKEDPHWTVHDEEQLAARLLPLFPDRLACGDFRLEDQWKNLRDRAQAIPGGCGLIVLDTFSRLSGGDENSAKETRPFLEAQAALAQATGAAVMAIHHVGKGNDTPSDKKLWERLHPEALRGSSAIEASARFILTMAALSPAEAERGGLELDHAMRGGYVALHLAKMSQGEKGSTLLLERRTGAAVGAGFLCPHPDSERVLAILQGESAILKLNLRDKVLLSIAEAGSLTHMDQPAAAALLWPDAKNALGQWQKQLTALRKQGWLSDPHLTAAGMAQAEFLGFTSRRKRQSDTGTEESQYSPALPPGSGETEEVEEKT